MANLRTFVIAMAIGAFWFFSAYFAVIFLPFPLSEYAFNCALFNFGLSLLAYAILKSRQMDREGLPWGLLVMFPIVYLTIGVIWAIFRPIFDLWFK